MKKSLKYYIKRNERKIQALSPIVIGKVISGTRGNYTVTIICPFCGMDHTHFAVESGDLRICPKSIWPLRFYKIILPQITIPIVEGRLINGFTVVFCPICKSFHFHGGGNLGDALPGRVIAHCLYGEYNIVINGGG